MYFPLVLFWNVEMLLADGIPRAEMHHYAKFRQNQSICCWDVLQFFKMANLDLPQRVHGGLCYWARFGYDQCSSFDIIWKFNYLHDWLENTYLCRRGFARNQRNHNKAHPNTSLRCSSHQAWKSANQSWSVGELPRSGMNKKNYSLYFTHLPTSPLWIGLHQMRYCSRVRGRNQPCKIFGDWLRIVDSVVGRKWRDAIDKASCC